MTAASQARLAQQLIRSTTAKLTGKERGPDRKVRRGSVDVGDRRAKVFRPIGDGTTAGALSWIDCLLKAVTEWDNVERRKHGGRPLGLYGIRVLEVLLGRHGGDGEGTVAADFRTGRIDPAIDTIARIGRIGRGTVVRALARLKAMKILDWVRRTERTGADGQFGPQRRQITNAYWFTPEELPARVLRRLRDLIARRRLRSAGTAPAAPSAPSRPVDPELAAALARMEAGIARRDGGSNASPPDGQYPCSGVKG